MSVREPDFQGQVLLLTQIHAANPNLVTELTAIATALASDTSNHDTTVTTPPAGLVCGASTSRFTNDVNLLVNWGKAGNLPNASMISAIDQVAGLPVPPGVIDVPFASANASPPVIGTQVSCTTGNWIGSPSSYGFQFTRDGTNIAGATASPYSLVAADIGGHSIRCVVSATNAQGTTAAPPSNAITT